MVPGTGNRTSTRLLTHGTLRVREQYLSSSHSFTIQRSIQLSLGPTSGTSPQSLLIETLHDASPDMRVLAIYVLETLKAKESLPACASWFSDQSIHFDGLGTVVEAAHKAVTELEAQP